MLSETDAEQSVPSVSQVTNECSNDRSLVARLSAAWLPYLSQLPWTEESVQQAKRLLSFLQESEVYLESLLLRLRSNLSVSMVQSLVEEERQANLVRIEEVSGEIRGEVASLLERIVDLCNRGVDSLPPLVRGALKRSIMSLPDRLSGLKVGWSDQSVGILLNEVIMMVRSMVGLLSAFIYLSKD